MPSLNELIKSIKNGRFTLDGTHLRLDNKFSANPIGGGFYVNEKNLTSLVGGPMEVIGVILII